MPIVTHAWNEAFCENGRKKEIAKIVDRWSRNTLLFHITTSCAQLRRVNKEMSGLPRQQNERDMKLFREVTIYSRKCAASKSSFWPDSTLHAVSASQVVLQPKYQRRRTCEHYSTHHRTSGEKHSAQLRSHPWLWVIWPGRQGIDAAVVWRLQPL